MRIVVGLGLCVVLFSGCQKSGGDVPPQPASSAPPAVAQASQVVEASCGECQFGMGGNGCDLAVRIDGKSYFVDGAGIDDHGDAHASDGLCNCIRKARVSGEIRDGRFVATAFELLPQPNGR
jgi:Family of unknown function (DUF6370)